jgi:predicted O-methyltransferase YrrM
MSKIKSIKSLYQQGGMSTLIYATMAYLKIEWLVLPIALDRIKRYEFQGIEQLVEFGSSTVGGIIKSLQVKEEIKELLELVKKHGVNSMIEIGTYNGGTLFFFTHVVSNNALIISIDYPDIRFGGGYGNWRTKLYESFRLKGQYLHLVNANSHNSRTLHKVNAILNNSRVDFIFIDGDHSYDGVKKDFEMYSSLLANDGMIAFHDIVEHPKETGCEVSKFWNEVKYNTEYKSVEIIHDSKQTSCGIGVLIKR